MNRNLPRHKKTRYVVFCAVYINHFRFIILKLYFVVFRILTSRSVVGGNQICGGVCHKNIQDRNQEHDFNRQERFCKSVLRVAVCAVNGTAACELGRDIRWGRVWHFVVT